ncbi:MAG: hypothetical protein M3Y49_05510 [Actinomycetota bacterium]|nr:hypothetical protein [Actinomycetota bacterium]
MSWVFLCVVTARVLVPLAIPRYPLPGILAAFFVDAVDQTVFQTFGGLPSDYEQYDKALDLYYQVIAYTSMMRNWSDPAAFAIGRFLWYFRLVGTVMFELSDAGWLLLIFPNTFEYFFMAYEVVRTRWDPTRMSRRALLLLAASIWIFVKLPQEWWIHVAKLDFTDQAEAHGWILPVVIGLVMIAGATLAACWHRLPARDWSPTVAVDRHRPASVVAPPAPRSVLGIPLWSSLAEKIVLVGMISVVFARVLGARATPTQIVISVVLFVSVNAAVSHVIYSRGHRWWTATAQFATLAAINCSTVEVMVLLRSRIDAYADPFRAFFLVLLMSLLIALFDRYRAMRQARIDGAASGQRSTEVLPHPFHRRRLPTGG